MNTDIPYPSNKKELYSLLFAQLGSLIDGERNSMPNLANAAALIGSAVPDIIWAGFYVLTDGELVLSSFAGLPACIRIQMGKGVCGTVAAEKRTIIVDDVHNFAGHIACDKRSRSEIVVPLIKNGEVVAVLDLDSDRIGRFSEEDANGLESLALLLVNGCEF